MEHSTRTIRTAFRLAVTGGVLAGAVVAVGLAGSAGVAHAEDPGVDCAEWDATAFGADVGRLNDHMVQVELTYDDVDAPLDVCPFTVFVSLRDASNTEVWSAWTTADEIETETASAAESLTLLMPHHGCGWEVRLGIEESLPIVLPDPAICLADLPLRIEFPALPDPIPTPTWSGVLARWFS